MPYLAIPPTEPVLILLLLKSKLIHGMQIFVYLITKETWTFRLPDIMFTFLPPFIYSPLHWIAELLVPRSLLAELLY
jgi:hypothetical protein